MLAHAAMKTRSRDNDLSARTPTLLAVILAGPPCKDKALVTGKGVSIAVTYNIQNVIAPNATEFNISAASDRQRTE
jgi:hypothetical protein